LREGCVLDFEKELFFFGKKRKVGFARFLKIHEIFESPLSN